jgi:hypothetical protein
MKVELDRTRAKKTAQWKKWLWIGILRIAEKDQKTHGEKNSH